MEAFLNTYGSLAVNMVLQAVLALSLYLPLMTGQLSLASPGFYALGGYIAGFLSTKVFTGMGSSFPIHLVLIEMALAALASAALALIVGIPALRLRGIYLALATIAFVEVLRVVANTRDLEAITGGAVGIYNIPQPFNTVSRIEYIVLAGPLLLISMWFVYRLERSRIGRAFIAIREDELAASAMGVNPTYYKVLAFMLGAALAGMTGAISAHLLNTWNARQGTFDLSIMVLAYVLIGGSRTFVGPVVGGLALTALPEVLRAMAGVPGLPGWLSEFLREGRLVIFGILIAVGTIFFPQGIITPELFKRRSRRTKVAALSSAASREPVQQ